MYKRQLYLFATSIDEVVVLLLALLGGFPLPLVAVQILWINIVTEGTLTLNLVMDPPDGDEMRRAPVPRDDALNGCQSNSRALEQFRAMHALEHAKQFCRITHVEAYAIVTYAVCAISPSRFVPVDGNDRRIAIPTELDRVLQQVGKYLTDDWRVAATWW